MKSPKYMGRIRKSLVYSWLWLKGRFHPRPLGIVPAHADFQGDSLVYHIYVGRAHRADVHYAVQTIRENFPFAVAFQGRGYLGKSSEPLTIFQVFLMGKDEVAKIEPIGIKLQQRCKGPVWLERYGEKLA